MSEDTLLTILMFVFTAILFIAVYIVPVAGVVAGCIIWKKRPQQKVLGVSVFTISILFCLGMAAWRIFAL